MPATQLSLGYRHEFARTHASHLTRMLATMTRRQRKAFHGFATATPAVFEREWNGSLPDLVWLAGVYEVDPRWLATGTPSPAGAASVAVLERAWKRAGTRRMGGDDREELVALLLTTPEPDKGAGMCRYCRCTDAFGCGECYWLDAAATICSTCLEPEED